MVHAVEWLVGLSMVGALVWAAWSLDAHTDVEGDESDR